jgi:enoyl-CoA hydratase/carnithine racemase
MRYMLTGDEWSAEEAYRMGLLQAITPPGEELKTAIGFAKKIAAAAPLGIRATLATARRALEGEAAVYVTLLSEFGPLWRTHDFQERVQALRENRPPVYQGK